MNCAGVLMPRLEERLERLVALQGQRAAIVGQSRGGKLAKVLARRRPDLVSGVVALGSPQVDPLAVHPLVRLQVEAVSRLGSLGAPGLFKRSCLDGDCCSSFWEDLAEPPARGVRLVSVYSKSDGVVDWHSCLDPHADEPSRSPHPTAGWRCPARPGGPWPTRSTASARRMLATGPPTRPVHKLPRAA